jgi:hypothetical protein
MLARSGGAARAGEWVAASARWLVVGLGVWVAGCAGVPQGGADAVEPGPARVGAEAARPPEWRSGEVVPVVQPRSTPARVLFDDPGSPPILFSQNPDLLRAEVAAECLAAQSMESQDSLRGLVAGLYLSVVDPGEGTEALILGNCAPVRDVVREMVSRGGEEALPSIVARARALSRPQARGMIETAAADGLVRYGELNYLGVGPTRLARDHAMAYFPSVGPAARIDAETDLDALYRRAVPGYGIYTFVLVGPGFERLPMDDQARHRELFRLVETYAAAAGQGDPAPRPEAHVFMIPVDSELAEAPLFNQVAADLSDRMRRQLIEDLRARGQENLAQRLENGSGPFLVAALGPNLIPSGTGSYRLLADLSEVGVEHLYDIVDAFDRGISLEVAARPESLTNIGDRLKSVAPTRLNDEKAVATDDQPWFFLLGGTNDAGAGISAERLILGVAAFLQHELPSA